MKLLTALAEILGVVVGMLAVRAMGGGWAIVVLLAMLAAALTWSISTGPDGRQALIAGISRRARHGRDKRTAPRTPRRQMLYDVWRVVRAVLVIVVVWNLISFFVYVAHANGDTVSQRIATWGRNNHLGSLIDFAEAHWYNTPPSKTPAEHLELATAITITTAPTVLLATTSSSTSSGTSTSGTPAVAVPTPATTTAPTAATTATTTTTTTTSTTVAPPAPPMSLTPPLSPALPGEGQWAPIGTAAGHDTMWATSIRPLPEAGGVVASMVVIDQTSLRAGLFNGAEEPGGTWKRGNRVPADLQPALLAAMNGGFRFEHIKGGYVTEGVTVKPLRNGDATLAVSRDGHIELGQLGRDLFDDGSWASLRQNLILIVDGGKSQVQKGVREGVWWGADYGNAVYVPRSAVCEMSDARLAYVLVGKVDAGQLAQALINLGCVKAMQMDINGTWPVFFTFAPRPDGSLKPQFLDKRMGGNPNRYLTGSTKEFFAFFDAAKVPAASVLDD